MVEPDPDAKDFVQLVMPTFQAESWVDVQLATILAQDHKNWQILIRDDASRDNTRRILRRWHEQFPARVMLLDDDRQENLGAIRNWSRLIETTSAPYVMFPSWDDVWYPDKISRALTAIQALEARVGAAKPIWVHTNYRIVDGNLREIHRTGWQYQGITPSRNRTLGRYFLEGEAGGATAIANRALARLATPIPPTAKYFDWWLLLVAAAFGYVEARADVSMDWRRHGANRSTVDSVAQVKRSVILNPLAHRQAFYEKFKLGQNMARLMLERFADELPSQSRAAAEAALNFPGMGFWERRREVIRHHILFTSRLKSTGFLMLM